MKRTIPTIVVALTLAAPLAAQQALPRSANGAPGEAGKGPAPVEVPRYPYAGNWDGTLMIEGATAPVKVLMGFAVADGARQSYNGRTSLDGGAAQTHMKVSAAPASDVSNSGDQKVLPRSSGGGAASSIDGSSASSSTSAERDTLAAGDRALLVYHTPTKSNLLCDEGHRCVALASLSWEETSADGKRFAYTAKLVTADTISGTVTITAGTKTETGTFRLSRMK